MECIHKLVKMYWACDSYLCLSLYASDKSLLELYFLQLTHSTCPVPDLQGNSPQCQRNAKPALAVKKVDVKNNWEDMTLTPVFKTLDQTDI